MEFLEENIQRLNEAIENEEFKLVCKQLNIFNDNTDKYSMVENIKQYISQYLRGEYFGQRAVEKFFNCINTYLKSSEFKRFYGDEYIENGIIDYNFLLPIKSDHASSKVTYRFKGMYLGPDRNRYIVKDAEGPISGGASGCKHAKYAKYNPTVAQALFKYLGEKSAEFITACEKPPYYHVVSKNFLEPNEEMFSLQEKQFECITDSKIKHDDIIKKIEEDVQERNLSSEKTKTISEKLKFQYAIQETLKNLICSMDENLGNTSIILTKREDGTIDDMNISPAYDMDLSFSVGEEKLKIFRFCRTTKDGKTDLNSIMEEFSEIEGYTEYMQEFAKKLTGNYTDEIFEIAYNSSGIDIFKNNTFKEIYGNFIMRRVAIFKESCKNIIQRQENIREEL